MKKLIYGLLICLVIVTGIVVFTTEDNDTKSDYTISLSPIMWEIQLKCPLVWK